MVTRSARRQTPAGRHLAAFFALVCAGCAGNGAGPRGAHDAEATAGAGAASPPLPRDGRATRRTWGWVSRAVGAEAAIGAIVTSGAIVHENRRIGAQCDAQKLC